MWTWRCWWCFLSCDLRISSLLFCGSTMDSLWCFLSVSRGVVNVLLLVTEILLRSFSIEFSSTMSMCRFCLNISPWSTLPLPMPVFLLYHDAIVSYKSKYQCTVICHHICWVAAFETTHTTQLDPAMLTMIYIQWLNIMLKVFRYSVWSHGNLLPSSLSCVLLPSFGLCQNTFSISFCGVLVEWPLL